MGSENVENSVIPSDKHVEKLVRGVTLLINWCGDQAAASGWDAGRFTRTAPQEVQGMQAAVDASLIASEAFELFEDLRNGRQMYELWYETKGGDPVLWSELEDGTLTKPCGPASELADIVIRCFHIARREHINLAQIIVQKLKFNATRGHKHGGKLF